MVRTDTLRRAPRARWLGRAAGLAALALAIPAGAATKPSTRAAAPTTTAPPSSLAAAPATTAPAASPRPAPAPALAAPRAAPSPAAAAAPGGPAFLGASVGALQSFGTGRSLLVQLDYALLRTPPSWRAFTLEWHLFAGFARPTGDKGLTAQVLPPFGTTPVTVNAGDEKLTALLFEVVPTARALWTPAPRVSFFGDAGAGLVQTFESYDRTEMYAGHSTRREYATGLVLRLGAGLALDVAPRWRVVFEPFAFDLMVGPKFSAWTPTLGLAFRL